MRDCAMFRLVGALLMFEPGSNSRAGNILSGRAVASAEGAGAASGEHGDHKVVRPARIRSPGGAKRLLRTRTTTYFCRRTFS